jgi:hypothetical protein
MEGHSGGIVSDVAFLLVLLIFVLGRTVVPSRAVYAFGHCRTDDGHDPGVHVALVGIDGVADLLSQSVPRKVINRELL